MSRDSQPNTDPLPFPEGTVLAGRYRIASTVGTSSWGTVVEGTDEAMRGRRVAVVIVPVRDRERHANAWLDANCPETAPLLDVIALDHRVAAIFDIDEGAETLAEVGGLSREQRASLVVSAARVLEHARDARVPVRLSGQGQLWVEGIPDDVRLRALPVPDFRAEESEVAADELAALARLISGQLYGIDAVTPPADALAALSDPLVPLLTPLYADDPATRLGAPPLARALARALSLQAGASNVPVPTAAIASPSATGARVTGAQRRARRATVREFAVASSLVALAALVFVPLLSTEDVYVADEPEFAGHESEEKPALPIPSSVTLPPADQIRDPQGAMFFATTAEDGPAPRGVGPLQQAGVPTWQRHSRFFPDIDGRPNRVEHFAPGGVFLGYVVYTYDPQGRIARREEYSSTGVPVRWRTYDYEEGTFEAWNESGEPEVPGCYLTSFTLDEKQRFLTQGCLDVQGRPTVNLDAFHSVAYEYEPFGETRTRRFFGVEGEPVQIAAGYAAVVELRDEIGRTIGRRYRDLDGRGAVDVASGAASVDYTYGARTLTTELYGLRGEAVIGTRGWFRHVSYYNPGGGLSSVRTYDIDDYPVGANGGTIATVEYTVDSRNLVTEERWIDAQGDPTVNMYGVHRITYIRDDHDNVLRECAFGPLGPITTADFAGAHCILTELDAYGLLRGEAYFGVDASPVIDDHVRVHQLWLERDVHNRVAVRRYRDPDGLPTVSWAHYYGVRFEYDQFGRKTAYEYIDADGALIRASHGVARVAISHDAYGRELRYCFFDTMGAPAALTDGIGKRSSCIEREFDGHRVVEIRYLGADGELTVASFDEDPHRGAAAVRNEHLPDGRLRWQRHFDADGTTQLGEALDCFRPRTCISENFWTWHDP